jgi:hypothetical protein
MGLILQFTLLELINRYFCFLVFLMLGSYDAFSQTIEIPSRFTIKVLNRNFEPIIEQQADSVIALQSDILAFFKQDVWEVVIGSDTLKVVDLEEFPYQEWRLTTNNKNFYLNRFGKLVDELDRLSDLPKPIIIPQKLRGYSYVNKAGEQGLWIVQQLGIWQLVDANGHQLFQTTDSLVFREGFIQQLSANGIGAWSEQGCFIATPARCGVILSDGYFMVDHCVTVAIVDTGGKQLFGPSTYFNLIQAPTDGYFRVRKKNKFGFANREGIVRVPCRYTQTGSVADGVTPISINGKWALVSVADNFLLQPLYDSVLTSCDSVIIANQQGLWGLFKSTGEEISKPEYKVIIQDIYGYACLNENGWGYRDLKGKVLLNQVYAQVKGLATGAIIFKVVGGYGLYNNKGILQVPANYQRIETDRMHSFYFLYN